MNSAQNIKVWDPLVRAFHWTLVTAFLLAYITEDDWMKVHSFAGYVVTGLLIFRVTWGFVGTRHARFSDFVFSPHVVGAYLKDLITLKARRFIGHNPAGGAMILALLASLLATSVSGMALYAVSDHAGPLVAVFGGLGAFWEDVLKETHEFLANFTVFLVFLHIAGVIVESVLHRENLVRAMWTGYKRATRTTA